jgi:hyperosmotically inducible periplasmic protein
MKRPLASTLVLLSAISTTPLFAGDKAADDRILDQVRMRLATDPDVKGGSLDVAVTDGVVVLKGRVDAERGKERATKLAKKIKGVKSVDNELSVGPPTP